MGVKMITVAVTLASAALLGAVAQSVTAAAGPDMKYHSAPASWYHNGAATHVLADVQTSAMKYHS